MSRTISRGERALERAWGQERTSGASKRLFRALSERHRRDLLYLRSHWRLPRHRHPRSLLEKINWRIVHDRRDVIAWACDKLATKEFAQACPFVRVPVTYWYGTDLSELAQVELPERWVLKPNNATGLIYKGAGQLTEELLASLSALTRGWYPPVAVTQLLEWGYTKAAAVLLVEEMLPGPTPVDFKFWVFHGEPRIIQVDMDRFSKHKMSFYTTDWQRLPVHSRFPRGGPIEPPPHLPEMIEAARFLSRGLDFMRVDLYDADGQVWFGELTPYPGSGLMKIAPARYNRAWGRWWALPELGH